MFLSFVYLSAWHSPECVKVLGLRVHALRHPERILLLGRTDLDTPARYPVSELTDIVTKCEKFGVWTKTLPLSSGFSQDSLCAFNSCQFRL